MAQASELTGGDDRISDPRQMWVREPDPRWSFWPKGAVPLLGLCSLLIYGTTFFVQKTEALLRLEVTSKLAEQGLSWVGVHVSGQDVTLNGAPPSPAARTLALKTARSVHCLSWLGKVPCVRTVTERFDGAPTVEGAALGSKPSAVEQGAGREPPKATVNGAHPQSVASSAAVAAGEPLATIAASTQPTPAEGSALPAVDGAALGPKLVVVRTKDSLTLKGAVPSEALKVALEAFARRHFPTGSLAIQLTVADGVATPGWERAAEHSIEVASRCERGIVTLSGGSQDVDCETQTVSGKDSMNTLLATRPSGVSAGTVNLLALDEVKSCEEGLVKLVTRSQVRFTTNSAKLLPTSRPLLREIAHQLERCPGVVVVEGHTDAQGVREENVTLSLNRARAVVAGLVGLGVSASRVRAEGFGPDQPLATNDTATGRAQNRRIEFRVARTGILGE